MHTVYGETEEEVLQNAKKHGIEVHGFTEYFHRILQPFSTINTPLTILQC